MIKSSNIWVVTLPRLSPRLFSSLSLSIPISQKGRDQTTQQLDPSWPNGAAYLLPSPLFFLCPKPHNTQPSPRDKNTNQNTIRNQSCDLGCFVRGFWQVNKAGHFLGERWVREDHLCRFRCPGISVESTLYVTYDLLKTVHQFCCFWLVSDPRGYNKEKCDTQIKIDSIGLRLWYWASVNHTHFHFKS